MSHGGFTIKVFIGFPSEAKGSFFIRPCCVFIGLAQQQV